MLRRRNCRQISSADSRLTFEDGGFLILAAFVATGVHVNSDERLGFINHDVAAALEMDLAEKAFSNCLEMLKRSKIGWASESFTLRALRREILEIIVVHAVAGFLAVHDDAFDVFGEEVAHGASMRSGSWNTQVAMAWDLIFSRPASILRAAGRGRGRSNASAGLRRRCA